MTYTIGIDLGGTNIKAGIVDENGVIVHRDRIKARAQEDQVTIIRDMTAQAKRLIETSGIPLDQIRAIGIGSPGTPDNEAGLLVYTNNLPFDRAPMRQLFHEDIDLPCYIDNDANVAALAESVAGAARGTKHSVTITLGTGVGSGTIINGRIYSGFNNAAAELGHTVVVVDGEPCNCGRVGCIEQYASARALSRDTLRAAKAHPESVLNRLIDENGGEADGRTAFIGMREGDAAATAVVQRYTHVLAEFVANVINSYMPEVIAIGGGVSHEGEALLEPVRKQALKMAYLGKGIMPPRIVLAEMGNDAGVIGAAMMAAQCLEDKIPG